MLPVDKYIEEFNERALELSKTKLEDAPKQSVLNAMVENMVEDYYRYVGCFPKPHILELLANYILINELKNKDVDKVTNEDYPILSDIQLKRRTRKQFLVQDSTLDFLNTKYHKNIDSLAKKTVKKADY